jgi:hypothetical protein
MRAECQCGQLHIDIIGSATTVVACHCTACQRRTGSAFGLMAHYPADRLSIIGDASCYERPTDGGGAFETYFCPRCGSSVYAKDGKDSTLILVAVGTIVDPPFQSTARSVWEESMHHWVDIPGDVLHFRKGRD